MTQQTLWTSGEIAAATGGDASGDFVVGGVSIDTREIAPGDLFVALQDQRDGHDFLDQAFAGGASGALVSIDSCAHPHVRVNDTLQALERLGAASRERSGAFHAAVTGSVGKTSVKEMIARIFRAAGPAHCNVKSFNNHWGVPLTLARMPRDTQRAVFEIGMNTPGEIEPRSRMVRPQLAMITKVAAAHLEGLGGVDAVADEKSYVFAGLEPGGIALLPREDGFFDYLKARVFDLQPTAQLLSFGGPDSGADARLVKLDGRNGVSEGEAEILGERVRFRLDAVGDHWGLNAVLALLTARLSGISVSDASEALAGFAPPPGRGGAETLALPGGGEFVLLDDAYNANPESMRAALAALAQRPGRRIAALGEMRELGPDADALHAALAGPIRDAGVAAAVLSGEGMTPLADALRAGGNEPGVWSASSVTEVINIVKEVLKSGDCVLIKGSNASGMNRVGQALRIWSGEAKGLTMNASETVRGA